MVVMESFVSIQLFNKLGRPEIVVSRSGGKSENAAGRWCITSRSLSYVVDNCWIKYSEFVTVF